MNYNYIFTADEEKILYKELKKVINSDKYKMLKKEYNYLITQISNNIRKTNINNGFIVFLLLMNNLDNYYFNNKINPDLDLDMLFKVWGSRVCTNNYSTRHLVSFVNDILIRSGFLSCKVLVDKKVINSDLFKHNIYNSISFNNVLLCLIINNKKVFIDLDENQILEYNNIFSKFGYNCYQKIFDKHHNLYFVNNDNFDQSNISR